jgi:large subunit ribosomal protein L30
MAKLKITQVKSKNGATERQIATLASLGLKRINQTVEREINDVTKGMVEKIRHLVTVVEIEEVKETKPRARAKKQVEAQAVAPVAEEAVSAVEEKNLEA